MCVPKHYHSIRLLHKARYVFNLCNSCVEFAITGVRTASMLTIKVFWVVTRNGRVIRQTEKLMHSNSYCFID